ncbi:hypothetical protein [Roseimaritima ulvae]|uniref:Uncharacterized protein n=1 Tax=Roseimaritima ulvae TaxID=980254 RepID=A0A5B9R1C8_9BACT|nr:hypothetical protein [Roseimaritima ulvae]QEG43595.1 hypothetical protein UC8_56460 [Roseimaritima ulvae]
MFTCCRWLIAGCLAWACVIGSAWGQPPLDTLPDARARIQKQEARLLSTLQMTPADAVGSPQPIALSKKPVLRYDDPTRANEFGSVWLWSADGRPTALLDSYRHTEGLWAMVTVQLDDGAFDVAMDGQPWWTPREPEVNWLPVPNGDSVAANERTRMIQMRNIARKFAAHEFWDPNNSRFELRLLPRPLHRYKDTARGIQDGTVFVFANGTNPEIILMLEARGKGSDLAWQMGFARLGHAEMHVLLDQQTIWTVPRANPTKRSESYWLDFVQDPN